MGILVLDPAGLHLLREVLLRVVVHGAAHPLLLRMGVGAAPLLPVHHLLMLLVRNLGGLLILHELRVGHLASSPVLLLL